VQSDDGHVSWSGERRGISDLAVASICLSPAARTLNGVTLHLGKRFIIRMAAFTARILGAQEVPGLERWRLVRAPLRASMPDAIFLHI